MRFMDMLLVFPALLLAIAIVTVLAAGLRQRAARHRARGHPGLCPDHACLGAVGPRDRTSSPPRARSARPAGHPVPAHPAQRADADHRGGTLGIATAVLDVAALSFIGLGAAAADARMGLMIGRERTSVFSAPHLLFFPGVALALTVLGFNLLGDGVRDALDPRLNR